jgi:para-nitrobenzyl esterase
MWVNFVKTGNPNAPGLPEWPKFNPVSRELMNISDNPEAQKQPFGPALEFQDKVAMTRRKGTLR